MRLGVCVLVSLIVAGCGARASKPVKLPQSADALSAYRVPQSAPPASVNPPASGTAAASSNAPAPVNPPASWTFAEFMVKARAVAAQARPPARASITQMESADPRLAAALLAKGLVGLRVGLFHWSCDAVVRLSAASLLLKC